MARQATPDMLAEAVDATPRDEVELVFGAPGASRAALQDVPVGMIDDNPFQPRTDYSGIEELAADIAANGLLQVPKGRLAPDGRVQLQYGHRRLRAVILLGWKTMPIEVQTLIADNDMAVRAWSENHNRQDFTAIDQARYFRKLVDAGWTQKQIADRLSLSAPTISNTLKLLRLPEDIQTAVAAGSLSARQADALLSVCELPKALRDRAEGFWDKRVSPTAIIQEALQGASSDSIRDRTSDLLQRFAEQIHEKAWYKHEFNPLDGEFKAISCASCPLAIKRDVGVFCSDRECIKAKAVVWGKSQLWLASQDSGIDIADDPYYSITKHESFMYESNGPAVLAAEPRCKNLKVVLKADFVDRNIRAYHTVPGHPEAIIVCQKAGNNQCLCLTRMKRSMESANPSKTKPAVLKREIIAPAADLLAAEIAKIPPGLLRIMMNQVREDRYNTLETYGPNDEDLALHQAENILKWHCADWKSPETNRLMASAILGFAGLSSPWSLPPAPDVVFDQTDDLVDIPTPTTPRPFPSTTSVSIAKARRLEQILSGGTQPVNGYIEPTVDRKAPDYIDVKLTRISNWINEFQDPGDGLPTPESVAGNFDNLEKLLLAINSQQSETDAVKLTMLYDNVFTRLAALSDRVQQSYALETGE